MFARKLFNLSAIPKAHTLLSRCVKTASNPATLSQEISNQFIPAFDEKIRRARKTLDTYKTQNNLSVSAYSTAEVYNLEALSAELFNTKHYKEVPMIDEVEDALHLKIPLENNDGHNSVYIFKKGSIVFWNVSNEEQDKILTILKKHSSALYSEALSREENELLDYTVAEGETRFNKGKIFLQSFDSTDLEKYAFSNGMSVSVKLAIWENLLQDFCDKIENIETANYKTIFESIKHLRALRRRITFHSELLEEPDFYWEQEQLGNLYNKTCQYFEIAKRTKVLNIKLDECFSQVGYLENELKDKKHIRLEKIIIYLILIEVVQGALHFYK